MQAVLRDVLATPISPELLPPGADGEIVQRSEDIVGPYELHDFFLYHVLRFGSGPRRLARLGLHAFDGRYPLAEIRRWLLVFVQRFFANQFKRDCMPDGPKVGSGGALSPRGDWRMPSDASPGALARRGRGHPQRRQTRRRVGEEVRHPVTPGLRDGAGISVVRCPLFVVRWRLNRTTDNEQRSTNRAIPRASRPHPRPRRRGHGRAKARPYDVREGAALGRPVHAPAASLALARCGPTEADWKERVT